MPLYFSNYIRKCREKCQITQEKMVEDLYKFDLKIFAGLDTTTLSKWERGITKPKIARQVGVVRYFQHRTSKALPCWENHTTDETKILLSENGMKNLLGKSKEIVLNFPTATIDSDDLNVYPIRNSIMMEKVIDINMGLKKDFSHNTSKLTKKHFETWAVHSNNAFYVCEYKEQFFGLLFSLRLKTESFDKIMNFEMEEKDLCKNDFASSNEKGTSYLISFFAMNEKAAAALFVRYYAHLIAHQNRITEVGGMTMMEDAKKLIANMNLTHHASKKIAGGLILQSYRATLAEFLACEKVIKMIFTEEKYNTH